jgi:putative serine/threonine protein kinase
LKIDINSPIVQHLISYPKFDHFVYQERIKELIDLGIEEIIISGPTKIDNLDILGKGHSGIVVKVNTNRGKNLALKIRRSDSPRKNSHEEAKMMIIANILDIGPKLIDEKKDFILMELIDGKKISLWIDEQSNCNNLISKQAVKKVINEILEQCYHLDGIYLDHGELTRIDNHIIISYEKKVVIIDFESSSINRKTTNVTSITHSLILGGLIAKKIKKILDFNKEDLMLENLRQYKKEKNSKNFEKIISLITES